MRAAPAIGALAITAVLTTSPLTRRVGGIMFACCSLGLATIVFALSKSFILSMAALAVLGASDAVSVVIRVTLVQLETPDEMRGRVNAVSSLFSGTSNQLGDFPRRRHGRLARRHSGGPRRRRRNPAGGADLDARISDASSFRQLLHEKDLKRPLDQPTDAWLCSGAGFPSQ